MNKWIGTGRLCNDVETRYSGETCIARYRLAVDRRFKREGEADADFIPCVAFGKAGEFAEKYFSKGMKVAVEGRIQTGSYTNKDGQTVYTTDIVIESQEFCESKSSGTNNAAPQTDANGFMNIPSSLEEELPFV